MVGGARQQVCEPAVGCRAGQRKSQCSAEMQAGALAQRQWQQPCGIRGRLQKATTACQQLLTTAGASVNRQS